MRRIPNGLKMSNRRKRAKAPNAYHTFPDGAANNAIHTPTISSTTTREGSSPQQGSRRLVAHIPITVKTRTRTTVSHIRHISETMKDNPNQISAASKAPAVPGAKGEKPEPKPVPTRTGKKEGFFMN